MGRKLRGIVPLSHSPLVFKLTDIKILREKVEKRRLYKKNFDGRHRAKGLDELEVGDKV